jgi:hypothetical protein
MTQAQRSNPLSADVALTFTTDRAKIASTGCGCFWLQGGSLDASVPIFRGLGVAANLSGEHSANIASGVDLSTVAFVVGPRYTFSATRWTRRVPELRHGTSVFGEALYGSSRGFDGAFITLAGPKGNASSLALQIGGGVDIGLARGFSVRAVEAEYVRTTFRNFNNNTQNDLRLAAGVTYHLGRR